MDIVKGRKANQMSETLKSRLKRSSIYALSPVATKRQCTKSSVSESRETDENQPCTLNDSSITNLGCEQNQNKAAVSDKCEHVKPKEKRFLESTCGSTRETHNSSVASKSCDIFSPSSKVGEQFPKNLKTSADLSLTPKCGSLSRTQKRSKTLTFSSPALKSKTRQEEQSNEECLGVSSSDKFNLNHKRTKLKMQLAEKEETLRKLKMVKMYRTKNNLEELQVLIDKWRGASQEALAHLVSSATTEPPPTLGQLMNHLQVDPELVRYNEEEDDFLQ